MRLRVSGGGIPAAKSQYTVWPTRRLLQEWACSIVGMECPARPWSNASDCPNRHTHPMCACTGALVAIRSGWAVNPHAPGPEHGNGQGIVVDWAFAQVTLHRRLLPDIPNRFRGRRRAPRGSARRRGSCPDVGIILPRLEQRGHRVGHREPIIGVGAGVGTLEHRRDVREVRGADYPPVGRRGFGFSSDCADPPDRPGPRAAAPPANGAPDWPSGGLRRTRRRRRPASPLRLRRLGQRARPDRLGRHGRRHAQRRRGREQAARADAVPGRRWRGGVMPSGGVAGNRPARGPGDASRRRLGARRQLPAGRRSAGRAPLAFSRALNNSPTIARVASSAAPPPPGRILPPVAWRAAFTPAPMVLVRWLAAVPTCADVDPGGAVPVLIGGGGRAL